MVISLAGYGTEYLIGATEELLLTNFAFSAFCSSNEGICHGSNAMGEVCYACE